MKKNTVLFVAFGSLGDVYPLLAIAKRMSTTTEVVFLANEYFRSHVEAANVAFFPIGTLEDQLKAKESAELSGTTIDGRRKRYENIIGKSYAVTFEFIKRKVEVGEKLLVVTHGNLSPAVIACEIFNIPIIYTHYAPSQIPDNYEDVILCSGFYSNRSEWWIRYVAVPYQRVKARFAFEVKEQYNNYRKQFGLPPLGGKWEYFLSKINFKSHNLISPVTERPPEIVLTPKWFCEPFDNTAGKFAFVGFPFVEEQYGNQEAEIDSFISSFGHPIVFTPGTAVDDVDALIAEMIPICRKLGSPGVFCSKHGKNAFDKLKKVDDVPLLYVEHAKFSHLLPKSRCLIHHGGIGTLAQAVRAGIPQIVRPCMYDQPFNGVRVMMFGLGGSIFPDVFVADRVADILLHIENSEQHREMLKYYSDLVKQEDGVGNACEFIEQFLNSHKVTDNNAEVTESCPAY